MLLRRFPLFLLALECIFPRASSRSAGERRQCAFQVTPQNSEYLKAGNVSGSVQLCEYTDCCVGYYVAVRGQLHVDVLACDVTEKSCPEATCKAQTRFNKQVVKCVCSAHLCNRNLTWTDQPEGPVPSASVGQYIHPSIFDAAYPHKGRRECWSLSQVSTGRRRGTP